MIGALDDLAAAMPLDAHAVENQPGGAIRCGWPAVPRTFRAS